MKKRYFLLLLLLPFTCVHAQVLEYFQGDTTAIKKFIPPGYNVLQYEQGDINLDNVKDVVLILNKTGETDSMPSAKANKRKTLLLIGDKMGAYQLAAQNDNVVYFYGFDDNFPEALEEMSIGKGSFTFVFYGGHRERWSRSITFTYNKQDNNWYLSKDEYGNVDVLDVEKEYPSHVLTSKNFGKVPFSRFNIYKATKYMDAYED